jgi:hypothetical protein
MAPICRAVDPTAPILQSLVEFLDCRSASIGELGYREFVGGTLLQTLLTSCLVIYVALIGYRLLFSHDFTVRDLVLSVVRIGLVTTFALSWSSYQTVVYRVVTEAPADLAAIVLGPIGLQPTSPEETASRLQTTLKSLDNTQGQTRASPYVTTTTGAVDLQTSAAQSNVAEPSTPGGQPTVAARPALLATSFPSVRGGITLVASTLGPLVAIRLVAEILLAIGPIVMVLTLFDNMLGILEGWVRALTGLMIGAYGATIVVALELAFLESETSGVSADASPLAGGGLVICAVVFACLMSAVLAGSGLAATAWRLRLFGSRFQFNRSRENGNVLADAQVRATASRDEDSPAPRSRAQATADAVIQRTTREQMRLSDGASTASSPTTQISWRNLGSQTSATRISTDPGRPAAPSRRRIGVSRSSRRS